MSHLVVFHMLVELREASTDYLRPGKNISAIVRPERLSKTTFILIFLEISLI